MLKSCNLCPHECKVNRTNNELGFCKCKDEVEIALSSLHFYEEPCISGTNGSGTIFFSHCNMNCVYCQNYEISQLGKGKSISVEHLAELFLKQQSKKAHNVNLVSPTPYVQHIIEAIIIAREKGFTLPIIYNTNGYEKIETLKMLEGYIDVYLPDFKYFDDELALKYSKISKYKEITEKALKEMYRQVGAPRIDRSGIIQRGMIIRHLVLPNEVENSKKILKWIKENMDNNVYISIMAQYFPCYKAKQIENLNRKLRIEEYEEVKDYMYDLQLENGYIQELGEHEEEYVPKFDLSE